MLCVLAVFLPVFFMQGAARNLFVPLALAVLAIFLLLLAYFQSPRWEALTGREEIVASNPAAYTDGQALTMRSSGNAVALER